MSHLIYELGMVIDRVLFVSPTERRLRNCFESIATDLVTNLGAEQDLKLVSTRLEKGALRSWMSFDLGMRSGLRQRVQLLGVALDKGELSRDLLMANEAMVLDWTPGSIVDDALLRLPLTHHNTNQPCLALLPALVDEERLKDPIFALRVHAQKSGLERSYRKLLVSPTPEEFLRQGLEWILSF
ncbi:MAG: hypothetical protein ABIO95_00735 [Bdellovibrionota bacterium]